MSIRMLLFSQMLISNLISFISWPSSYLFLIPIMVKYDHPMVEQRFLGVSWKR